MYPVFTIFPLLFYDDKAWRMEEKDKSTCVCKYVNSAWANLKLLWLPYVGNAKSKQSTDQFSQTGISEGRKNRSLLLIRGFLQSQLRMTAVAGEGAANLASRATWATSGTILIIVWNTARMLYSVPRWTGTGRNSSC